MLKNKFQLMGLLLFLYFAVFHFPIKANAIEFEGYDHLIEFGQHKIALREKNGGRDCYWSLGKDSIFMWGGKPQRLQNIYLRTFHKPFLKDVKEASEKKAWEDWETVPVKMKYSIVNYEDGSTYSYEKIARWDILPGKSLGYQGLTAWSVLQEVHCSGKKVSFATKHGGKLEFTESETKKWKKPFLALQSCINDSGNFQFENADSDFSNYNTTQRKCWWDN